ncbi:MAG: radical SAM protein [Candidatus Omnitrophica bacterium]|nr:radical SAM protein [Candidatus Omnitrophota bacterium]MDE2221579.1 radical SAM protein [Candidatus Omnitrophota bacterium]
MDSLSPDHLRIIGAAQQKLLAGPERILLNIISECPLRCSFCYTLSYLIKKQEPRQKAMSMALIRRIAEAATRWNVREITLIGRGEPTSHPHFRDIVSEFSSRNIAIDLLTNATFSRQDAPSISKIARTTVNFCSPDRESFIKIQAPRNPAMYDLVLRNIKFLVSLEKKYKKPCMEIIFILTHETIPLMEPMLKWAEKAGIQRLRFQFFDAIEETKFLSPDQKDLELLGHLCLVNSEKDWPFKHNLKEIAHRLKFPDSGRPPHCYEGWFSLYVDSDNSVRFCCLNKYTFLGNLNDSTLEEIWESPQAQKTRLRWLNPFPQNSEEDFCARCPYCKQNLLHDKNARDILNLSAKNAKSYKTNEAGL